MANTNTTTTGAGNLRALQANLGRILLPPKRNVYRGWKSGMRSRGWVAIENETSGEALHFHEVKTVGPVTMERHSFPYQRNGLFWLVNGERFDKLKDAVKRADLIMAEAGWIQS